MQEQKWTKNEENLRLDSGSNSRRADEEGKNTTMGCRWRLERGPSKVQAQV